MALTDGDDYVVDTRYDYAAANRDKNHWPTADPTADFSNPQEGMIAEDTTNKIWQGYNGSNFQNIGSGNQYAVNVYNNANIALTNGTYQSLTFNTELFDPMAMHSLVANTGRLTSVLEGYYQVTGNVEFAADATGFRRLLVKKNNTTWLSRESRSPVIAGLNEPHITTTVLVYLDVGDYVELVAYQNSGGDLNVQAWLQCGIAFMMALVGKV